MTPRPTGAPVLDPTCERLEVKSLWPTHPYIPMAKGFVYLVAVMDWFSRRVLSWRLSITMEADFCVSAATRARKIRSMRFRSHAIYNFGSGIWVSADATYFAGGQTTINGRMDNDLQQNWRFGTTASFPLDRLHSIRLTPVTARMRVRKQL